MEHKYKISFCTVSMNRLFHLQQTLLKNIRDNLLYANLEFVVLDYNSKDNTSEWILQKCRKFLEQGILKYFKTTEPLTFHRSHSRNMCFRLATGDILCNVDADNFTGEGFADYINESFQQQQDIFLTGDPFMRDAIGRFSIRKEDFLSINGYNESINSYGFEDLELYDRLVITGKKQEYIKQLKFLDIIHHSSFERIANEKLNQGLKKIFVAYKTPYESDLVLVYEQTALKADMINYIDLVRRNESSRNGSNKFSALKGEIQHALYFDKDGEPLCLFKGTSHNHELVQSSNSEQVLVDRCSGIHFHEIMDKDYKDDIVLLLSELSNKQTMIKHLTAHKKVNEAGFGSGKGYSWNDNAYILA